MAQKKERNGRKHQTFLSRHEMVKNNTKRYKNSGEKLNT